MVAFGSFRQGLEETEDRPHQGKHGLFGKWRTELSRKASLFGEETDFWRRAYSYSVFEGIEGEQNGARHWVEETREEVVHFQRGVSDD